VYAEGGVRKDGSRFPVELAINPFEVDGQQYFSTVVRDLSEHWQAEAKLHRLAAAIEQAGDAIAILDAEHRIQYVNPQYERQTGFSADQIIGQTPSSGASGSDVYAEIWDTVAQGRKWTGQVRSRRGNGQYCEEELTVAPVCDSRGKVTAYVAVMRDVTRRLEGELERRRLAEALQHCTDSIEILDAQGRIVYVNAAFEISTGQRLADIRGSRPEALSDFTMAEASYQDMLRTAYRGGRPWSGTLKSLSLSGDLREEDVTVSPVRDENGSHTGYVVVKRDTTNRRRLEAQAQQKQKLESIGQLADGIATELSRPMQQLADHLRFLRDSFGHLDGLLAELAGLVERRAPIPAAALGGVMQNADVDFLRREIGEALDHSGAGVQQMTEIVHAMRAISYSGRERTAVDLNRALQSTITISSSEWRSVAEIRTDFDPDLPPVRCAPGDVSLVLLNLLVNSAHAIAASNPSGIRGKGIIGVSTRRLDKWAEIRVERSGNAVSPEQREQMFDPSAAGASADPVMALAHDVIVTRHGGSLALESEQGRGAAFVLRLPIGNAAAASSTAAA
jgi:PAS domain S-box-containing protein